MNPKTYQILSLAGKLPYRGPVKKKNPKRKIEDCIFANDNFPNDEYFEYVLGNYKFVFSKIQPVENHEIISVLNDIIEKNRYRKELYLYKGNPCTGCKQLMLVNVYNNKKEIITSIMGIFSFDNKKLNFNQTFIYGHLFNKITIAVGYMLTGKFNKIILQEDIPEVVNIL